MACLQISDQVSINPSVLHYVFHYHHDHYILADKNSRISRGDYYYYSQLISIIEIQYSNTISTSRDAHMDICEVSFQLQLQSKSTTR